MNCKFINYLFVILVICSIVNCQQCSTDIPLLAIGATCKADQTNICKLGYCNSTTLKCVAQKAKDSACTANNECLTGGCVSSKCGYIGYAFLGDDCVDDSSCVNPTKMECTSNICAFKSGQSCAVATDCANNQYCKVTGATGECLASSDVNGACQSRYDCKENLVCSYSDNTNTTLSCQLPYTKQAGDKCNSEDDPSRIPFFYDCDISKGLMCSNSKCVANSVSQQCSLCMTATDCKGYGESCMCNTNSSEVVELGKAGFCSQGVYITSACKTTFTELMTCAVDNNCPMNQRSLFTQGGCLQTNCNTEACKMSSCFNVADSTSKGFINMVLSACTNYKYTDIQSECSVPITVTPSPLPSSSSSLLPALTLWFICIILAILKI